MSQYQIVFINFRCIVITLFFLCFAHYKIADKTTEFDFGTITLTSLKLLGDAHLSNDEAVGAAGGYLGLLQVSELQSEFVAVEFDTLMYVEFWDINSNPVGLYLNSMVSTEAADLGDLDIELKTRKLINSWNDYDGENRIFNISVSYANLKPIQPLLSFVVDLDQYVDDFMFVGFSGSTQGSTEIHSIDWWSFSSHFVSNSPPGSLRSSPPPPTPPPTTDLMIPVVKSESF